MEELTRNKIVAINEAINAEIEELTNDMEFRVKRIARLKDEILNLLDEENKNGR